MADATFRMLSTGASWSGNERNHLFLGRPGEGRFVRVSGISGLDDGGDSMSAALLDIDRDGWMDVALGNISKPRFRLLRNAMRDRMRDGENGFIAMRFVGGNDKAAPALQWSNRDGRGARVELTLDSGRRLYREYTRQGGFKSENTGTLLVGTGASRRATGIHVTWPSGREQTVQDVDAGTLVTMYENPEQSPRGEAAVREPYTPAATAKAAPTTLRLAGVHGEEGVTVYTTMSTFCLTCAKSQPDLRALKKAFGNELTLVGIPVAKVDTEARLEAYVKKKRPAYAVQIGLPDATVQKIRDAVTLSLHADGETTPASFVTDSTGRILMVRWGVPTLSELKRLQARQGVVSR